MVSNHYFIAHLRSVDAALCFHDLPEHLQKVSTKAAEFADHFGSADWAIYAGLWHDLGKYRPGFQRYILQACSSDAHIEGRIRDADKTHSAAGALWAGEHLKTLAPKQWGPMARVLAYLIAGHHAGLSDWAGDNAPLGIRLAGNDARRELADILAAQVPDAILKPDFPAPSLATLKRFTEALTDRGGEDKPIPGRFALWVRMLYSCLVDADFLNTERFMDTGKAAKRVGFLTQAQMDARLTTHLERLAEAVAARGEAESAVNRQRRKVLAACLENAEHPPGVFSLTVPTGGGKTLSSLAFALRHAVRHGKRRVIYAIPYTSIIEQTASIFGDIFGEDNVIEHHSNVEVDPHEETHRSRLACENWDAPLIVTTNVQLLESLFAHRSSRCRKLHNLVGSVIVLDEAQLLPVDFLQPVIDVLRLLVKDYGVTLVLCTATQPTLENRIGFDQARGLRGFAPGEVREIVTDVTALYADLRRVRVHRPADLTPLSDWAALAPQIAARDAVLAIVSRRADAAELYCAVRCTSGEYDWQGENGLWHLSGLMCARHRRDTIAAIKNGLAARREALARGDTAPPVRVVSTQLVEAGVDIDFPVVYRALAGLDSIAQAAGRCNREGRLASGDVHVFIPPKPAPQGLLRMAENATRMLWKTLPEESDLLAVEHFATYFRQLYGDLTLDRHGICDRLRVGPSGEVNFRTVSERFKLIDEKDGATVFVRYRRDANDTEIDTLLALLQKEGMQRWLLRKLQAYGVGVYHQDLDRMLKTRDVIPLGGDFPGIYLQSPDSDLLYDRTLGLNVAGAPGDPSDLIG